MATFQNVFLTASDLDSLTPQKPKNYLEPQYEGAFSAWLKDRSEMNRESLLQAITPVIANNVALVGNADKNYLTIQGKILAMKAMEKYDPQKASIATYLSKQLYPLRRYARQQMNVLKVPERMMLASQRLESAEVELEDLLGRAPTTDELSDHMGISVKQIERVRRSGHARNSGSYEMPDEEGNFSSPAVRRDLPQKYLHEYILSALDSDPVSRLIYENDWGLHGRVPLSNQELASKLRLSAGAVSQRRRKILEMVNNAQQMIYAR